jgi:hypothetical protein
LGFREDLINGLEGLSENCKGVLQGFESNGQGSLFGELNYLASSARAVQADSASQWDLRMSGTHIRSYEPDFSDMSLREYVIDAYGGFSSLPPAWVLPGTDTVFLSTAYYGSPGSRGATAVHEALHMAFGRMGLPANHADILGALRANTNSALSLSDQLDNWLNDGCPTR